jgi:Zn-dependent peptidase ImmA (M78 family)
LTTATLNINRLLHLLTLYGVSKDELLLKINVGLKNLLTENDIFTNEIKISHLKKIDKIFNKGLGYYLDPKNPVKSTEESIFFRKDKFNAELNLGAKQIVNRFEEEKIAFSTLAKLSDFKLKRNLPVYKITDNPNHVAHEARKILYPDFIIEKRDFLKNFISKLSENNILVFEFVETHNKKEKANINGFYLAPDVIVLKRNQKSLRREVFTLAHELAHYLLNEEEIDDVTSDEIGNYNNLNVIERWCNDFAYFFLVGDYYKTIDALGVANANNDYHTDVIEKISHNTHLSSIALYTRLLLHNKISPTNYKNKSDEIFNSIKEWEAKEKERLEREKQKALDAGRKPGGAVPKPIISPLYFKTLQSALYNGLINEADFCKKLSINPQKIEKYLI